MANLKNVIYLSNSDYETLVTTGTVTIGSTTLTYDENNVYITPEEVATTTDNGLMSSTDKTKLDAITSQTAYTTKGSATKVPQITTNSYGQVTAITEVTITQPTTTSQLTNNSNFVSGTGLDSDYIVVGNGNSTVKKGGYTISGLKDIAEGKTASYVIATKACITGTEDGSTGNYSGVSQILTAPSGGTALTLANLNVGDNIYIMETEVPDYWVSSKSTSGNTTTLGLSKLETTKVNLTGFAPTSHATNATTYGVGTTSNYGHVKLKTGDVSSETAADGVAASSSHNHDNSYYPKTGNPSGFLTGITSSDVTTALGFTPTANTGTVTSVNNTSPTDGNVNVGTVTGVTAGAGLNTTSNDTATDGGTISGSGTLYLTKSGVTAGTYQGITVDKYGRVTSASDQGYGTYSKPSGGIPSTDLADSYLKLDGTTTMTGKLNLKATGNNDSNIGDNGIRWGTTSLPQDSAPQYFCTIDAFASGGRQKWASLASVKSALGVPSAVTESTVSGWGFTKNAGTVTSVNGVSPTNGNVALTLPPTITINTTNNTVSDGTNTLTFGSNAFNSDRHIKYIDRHSLPNSSDTTIAELYAAVGGTGDFANHPESWLVDFILYDSTWSSTSIRYYISLCPYNYNLTNNTNYRFAAIDLYMTNAVNYSNVPTAATRYSDSIPGTTKLSMMVSSSSYEYRVMNDKSFKTIGGQNIIKFNSSVTNIPVKTINNQSIIGSDGNIAISAGQNNPTFINMCVQDLEVSTTQNSDYTISLSQQDVGLYLFWGSDASSLADVSETYEDTTNFENCPYFGCSLIGSLEGGAVMVIVQKDLSTNKYYIKGFNELIFRETSQQSQDIAKFLKQTITNTNQNIDNDLFTIYVYVQYEDYMVIDNSMIGEYLEEDLTEEEYIQAEADFASFDEKITIKGEQGKWIIIS